jgi:DeoR/GlpR family transcriptional regulator of sugar metabolism
MRAGSIRNRQTKPTAGVLGPGLVEGRRMPAAVRQGRIVEAVRTHGFVSVAQVANALSVSEMTIRRDLMELERDGQLLRTHGGALAPEGVGDHVIDRTEPAFDARLRKQQAAKRRIALAALEFVRDRRTVALDVGTTVYSLASLLVDRPGVKTFTNSLRIAALLGEHKCDVFLPGGQVRGDEMSLCGPTALSQFEHMWFDVAFIGVSGVTADGLFDYSLEDSEMKRVYLRRSKLKALLCDASKFHHLSLVRIAPLADIDVLVTEAAPPADVAAALAEAGVELRIADQDAAASS